MVLNCVDHHDFPRLQVFNSYSLLVLSMAHLVLLPRSLLKKKQETRDRRIIIRLTLFKMSFVIQAEEAVCF